MSAVKSKSVMGLKPLFARKPGEPQSFKGLKRIVSSLGYVSLEERLNRLQLAGLRTIVARDKFGQMLPIPDEYYDKDLRPVLFNRHEVPDVADVHEAYLVMKERRERIFQQAKERKAEKERAQREAGVQGPPPVSPAEPRADK